MTSLIDDTAADKHDLREFVSRGQFANRVEKNDSGVAIVWIGRICSPGPAQSGLLNQYWRLL